MIEFTTTTKTGEIKSTKQLCYVCTKVDTTYLSRQALTDLGSIPENFPHPIDKNLTAATITEDDSEGDACTCPERPHQPPPVPTELPEGTDVNKPGAVEDLKNWLIQYYKSSTLNT